MSDFTGFAAHAKEQGWDKPNETNYTVVQTVTYHYAVTASTPEEAAEHVRDCDAGDGDCIDATVEKVVPAEADTFDADDLRTAGRCRSCGAAIDPVFAHSLKTCNDCFFERVRA